MTPEQIAKAGTEHAHQAALFCWANSVLEQYPMLRWMHAIPNGGLRNKVTASRLKAEGVKSGVSDVFLPYPKKSTYGNLGTITIYCGLYIEMKKPGKGRLSTDQSDFIIAMLVAGYATDISESWEEARDTILAYLSDSY